MSGTAAATAPSPARLAELFAARAAWVGRAPGDPLPPGAVDTTVLVLLRAVDRVDLVNGARAFAAGLTGDEADAWRGSWTRTRFLFGNPANLTPRTAGRVVAAGGSAAWLGPLPAARLPGLSRLLKPVTGVLPAPLPDVLIPPVGGGAAAGGYRELFVAVRGLTLADYLVHLHHTVAEAVLMRRLSPGEPLRLVHRPDLDGAAVRGSPAYARVHHDRDPAQLRLFTWLSGGPAPAPHA